MSISGRSQLPAAPPADATVGVRLALAEVLGLLDEEIAPGASLRDDLGALTEDLDPLVRAVRRHTGIAIEAGDLPLGSITVDNLTRLVAGLRRLADA